MKSENNLRMQLKEALDNLWARIKSLVSGLDTRVTALEQGGGGGGQVNVIEAISFNGTNVPPDASKRVSLQETDPTVPSWAKAVSKPSYTASEVGALADTTTFVSGVKGAAEAAYRSGQVELSPANLGAVAKSGDTMTGPLTMSNNNYHYWVNSAGDRRWIVYPSSAGNEFYIATQEKVNGEWTNWKGVLVASTDGTIALNQPLAVTAGGTGARNPAAARTNLGVTPVLLNNSSGATGLNVDFSTYGAFIIKMPDNVTTVVHMTGTADAEYWSTASLYGSTSSPVVLKNYCWKVNSSGTGFYLNTTKSYQINFSSTGTPSIYQITNNKFYKVWGITN